jgi:threonine/homoserine/homoserine lactone efflux protein
MTFSRVLGLFFGVVLSIAGISSLVQSVDFESIMLSGMGIILLLYGIGIGRSKQSSDPSSSSHSTSSSSSSDSSGGFFDFGGGGCDSGGGDSGGGSCD